MKEQKTNVMRILDSKGIEYNTYDYEKEGYTSGKEAADFLGIDKNRMFKTLVVVAPSKNHYVFMVPVENELDLKKAASCVSEKSVTMIQQKELLPLTGYVHGGCSPIGMKKVFKTVCDITALDFEKIVFSAGKIGRSVEFEANKLKEILDISFIDIKKIKE